MAKICKSCGEYYKGDYCPKCGYGKSGANDSKSLSKLKKQALRNKPERFMTSDEKKELYAMRKQKQQTNIEKTQDPHARRNLLIIVAIVAVCVVFGVLIKNGLIFKTEKTDVITDYFTALSEKNYDDFVKCFPSEIKDAYDDDRASAGYTKDEYMEAFIESLSDEYGSGFTIDVELGSQTEIASSEMDMTSYKEAYGSAPTISEAYSVVCDVTYSGSKKTETCRYECYIAKTSGKWKIFNMQYNPGTITDSTAEADSSAESESQEDSSSSSDSQ